MNRYAGIIYRSPQNQCLLHLPLQQVNVKVWMVDISARVVLSQKFENLSESPTSRAKYVFPLPASAATCAFELEHADGRVIVGVAKEKSQAAQAFHTALNAGKTAGLVEWVTDDIFTISIGSIPARQTVTARLTFVMDLLDEGRQDHIRLQLPMAIAQRYGEMPTPMLDASTTDEKTLVRIAVDVQTSDAIQAIRSPNHPISLMRYKTRSGRKSERRMSATWSSTTFLDHDFVLTVHAFGLDEPRCFAEFDDAHGGGGSHTIAMQLSFVPKFNMPRVASQEYIFVIDRSGSMGGNPIEIAKQTLELLLHLLPDSQTTFNIFSFGDKVDGMWGKSVSYNDATLQDAISRIQVMQADYGGTEIANALQFVINSRNCDCPTAMFVLTDGNIYSSTDLDPFSVVSTAMNSCKPDAPLRIFMLGIGGLVSSEMCERLARSGGGECLFAVQAEDITAKCATLLNAGRTRRIDSVTIDWHGSGIPPTVNFSPSNHRHSLLPSSVVELEPPPPMQQVPHAITKIFPGVRFKVFAITSFGSVPREVRLRAKVESLDEELELVVPVTTVKPFKDEQSSIPLIHTLAARELVKHLADDMAPLPKPLAPASDEEVRKAAIVRLGLEYQLVSQHTSFVAIESGGETARNYLRRTTSWQKSRRRYSYVSPPGAMGDVAEETHVTTTQTTSVLDNLSQFAHAVFSFFFSPSSSSPDAPLRTGRQGNISGAYNSGSPPSMSEHSFEHDNSSTETFSTMSSLDGSSTNSRWTYSRSSSPFPPPPPDEDLIAITRAPSPTLDLIDNAPPGTTTTTLPTTKTPGGATTTTTKTKTTTPVPEEARALIALQSTDGSFIPTSRLGALVGVETLSKAAELQVDGTIWATAVAVAYLKDEGRLGGQPDVFDALMSKVMEFVVEGRGRHLLRGREFLEWVVIAGQCLG